MFSLISKSSSFFYQMSQMYLTSFPRRINSSLGVVLRSIKHEYINYEFDVDKFLDPIKDII